MTSTQTVTAKTVLDWFESVDRDIDRLVREYPAANDWFIAEGYKFETGIVGELYLLHCKDGNYTVSDYDKGPNAAQRLLETELRARVRIEGA